MDTTTPAAAKAQQTLIYKSYLTDPKVLEEFQAGLEAETSTAKERFARCLCRLLMKTNSINLPLTSEGNDLLMEMLSEHNEKCLPPQPHEIAALYKMLMTAPLKDKELYANVDYSLEGGPVAAIYYTWMAMSRDERRRPYPPVLLPTKTNLAWDNGAIKQWGRRIDPLVVNNNGCLLDKDPHEMAFECGWSKFNPPEYIAKMVDWAYSIEPIRPPKYVAMFLNRDMAKGLSMNDALAHTYAENWGIVKAIIYNHHYTDADTSPEVWEKIASSTVDHVNQRLKNIEVVIELFNRGYRMDYHIWESLLRFAMLERNCDAVCRLMQTAGYIPQYSLRSSDIAAAVVKRYQNLQMCDRSEAELEKYTMRHIFAMFKRYSSSDDERLQRKRELIASIRKVMEGTVATSRNSLDWLKELLEKDDLEYK